MPAASFAREIEVTAPRQKCWETLTDVPTLVRWVSILEDAREVERLERYRAVLLDRLGMFRLRADLDIEVLDVRELESIRVSASGEDRQVASRITVDAVLKMQDRDGGTHVGVEGTYEVSGRVATMGASTIRKKADKILDEFFDSVAAELGA